MGRPQVQELLMDAASMGISRCQDLRLLVHATMQARSLSFELKESPEGHE